MILIKSVRDNGEVHSDPFYSYIYDSVGKLLSVEDVTGVTTMDYYANHLLHRITYPDTRFLEYTYDSAGRRSSLTDQTGYQQKYSYNFDGQLEIISDGTGKILAQYSYDLSGRLTGRTLGNGVSSTYQYDKSNRVTAIVTKGADGGLISDYAYAFDVNNRRTKVTSREGVWDYTYDATGQLIAAAFTSDNPEVPSKTIEYVYDKVGNRIQEIVNGSSTAYDINNMNQYSQAGVFAYSYDLDGNLIEKSNGVDRWIYEYNDNNRLIRSVTPEGEKEYIYNGLGYLVSVIADGVAKNYMVDPMGFGNVVGEYDESGTLLSRYTHGLGLISKDENFYTFDGNGNTSEMTNAANEIINFYGYEPFGNNLFEGESVENDFEFVGQLGVREMGEDLIYMRNRFYSPALGRFMAEDPIGLAGGDVSFYRYVQNDPVNWVDPLGLNTDVARWAPPLILIFPEATPVIVFLVGADLVTSTGGDGLIDGVDYDEFGPKDDASSKDKAITDVTDNAKDESCDEAVPDDECEDPPKTCKEEYPDIKECSEMPYWYYYNSASGALNTLKAETGYYDLRWGTQAESTSGPCPGSGWHYNVRGGEYGGAYPASIVGCPCCIESGGGPNKVERWGIWYH